MGNLNKVMIIGNVGRDAELRYTANGTAVANFSVAVNSNRRNQSGDWEEETEWFNVTLWADRAERQSQYITKGMPIFVEGRLRSSNWDDDQGVRHYRTEIVANNVQFLERRSEANRSSDDWGGGGAGGGDFGGGRGRGSAPSDVDDLPFE